MLNLSLSLMNQIGASRGPRVTAAPVITGTPEVGETLSVSTGTWTGEPTITYAYQWRRDGVVITGATSATYDLVAADNGAVVSAAVTATDGNGDPRTTIASGLGPVTYPAPAASGTVPDQTLTVGTAMTPLNLATYFTGDGLTIIRDPEGPAVPAGLTLSPEGVLSGTPTEAGTIQFSAIAVNSGGVATQTFEIAVSAVSVFAATRTASQIIVSSVPATIPATRDATGGENVITLSGAGSAVEPTHVIVRDSATDEGLAAVAIPAVPLSENLVIDATGFPPTAIAAPAAPMGNSPVTVTAPGSYDFTQHFAASEDGFILDATKLANLKTATDGTGDASAVDDVIAYLADSSGNGLHFTQATSGNRPLLKQDGGGRWYLSFDSDDFLTNAAATPAGLLGGNPRTFIFVGRVNTTNGATFSYGVNSGRDSFQAFTRTTGASGDTLRITNNQARFSDATNDASLMVASIVLTSTADMRDVVFRQNGVARTNSGSSINTATTLSGPMFLNQSLSTEPNGSIDLYFGFLCSKEISGATLATLEAEAAALAGLSI